jgi:hypothetical protein
MWVRTWVVFAAVCLAATTAAAQKPPANEDCLACHGDASLKRDDGRSLAVDPSHFQSSIHGPLACVDCHAALAKTSDFPHDARVARVQCATCHDDISGKYHDSIHGWAKDKAGLTVAPSCTDCHGTHDIRAQYDRGVHGAALKKGSTGAPICVDCHSAHSIARTDTDKWRLSVTAECGTCHATVVDSFRRTFHGKVTERRACCLDGCSTSRCSSTARKRRWRSSSSSRSTSSTAICAPDSFRWTSRSSLARFRRRS